MTDSLPELGFMPSYVYRFFTADGEILYVGVTRNLNVRLEKHRKEHADEWHLVADMSVEVYADRYVAENVERVAILRDRPRWNRQKWHPSPRVPDEALAETGVPIEPPKRPRKDAPLTGPQHATARPRRKGAGLVGISLYGIGGLWFVAIIAHAPAILELSLRELIWPLLLMFIGLALPWAVPRVGPASASGGSDRQVPLATQGAPPVTAAVESPAIVTNGQRSLTAEESIEAIFAALLAIGRPALCSQVAERVERSPQLTRMRLSQLIAAGRVLRIGEGRWTRYTPVEAPPDARPTPPDTALPHHLTPPDAPPTTT